MSLATIAAERPGLLVAGIWLLVTGGLISCYGRQCDPSSVSYGQNPGEEGRMIDENTWESSAMAGAWLPFPGDRTYFFTIRKLGGRIPSVPVVYISPSPTPNAPGSAASFTSAGGNVAELIGAGPDVLAVRNGTCSDYYMRLVVPVEPFAPEVDAGQGRDGADQPAPEGRP